MITVMRAAAALALTALPLTLPSTAHAAAAVPEVLPIGVAVSALHVAEESREGYQRDAFKHWNSGENKTDGCDTRIICMPGSGDSREPGGSSIP